MRKFFFGSKKRIAAWAAVLTLVVPAVAVAAWLVTGGGSGLIGPNGHLVSPTLSPEGPASGLMPGGWAKATFRYDNPNSVQLTITDGGSVSSVTSSDEAACPASNYTLNPAPLAGAILEPSTTNSALSTDNFVIVTLSANAPSGCQDASASFTLSGVTYST